MKIEIEAKIQATVALLYILDESVSDGADVEKLEENGETILEYAQMNASASHVVFYGANADNLKFQIWELSEDGARVKSIGRGALQTGDDMDELLENGFFGFTEGGEVLVPALIDDQKYLSDEITIPDEAVLVLEENPHSDVVMSCIIDLNDDGALADIRACCVTYDGPGDLDQFLYENISGEPEYDLRSFYVDGREFLVNYELEMEGRIQFKTFRFREGSFEQDFSLS
jgi:hypothetical protein